MAAEAELGGVPPSFSLSLPLGPPLPRGGGDSPRPYRGRGAGLGPRGDATGGWRPAAVLRGRWGAAGPGRAGPRSRRGAPSEPGVARGVV